MFRTILIGGIFCWSPLELDVLSELLSDVDLLEVSLAIYQIGLSGRSGLAERPRVEKEMAVSSVKGADGWIFSACESAVSGSCCLVGPLDASRLAGAVALGT